MLKQGKENITRDCADNVECCAMVRKTGKYKKFSRHALKSID